MKTFTFTAAALFSAVTFAALNGNPGADAQNAPCGDAPGMDRCSDEKPVPSSEKDGEVVVPRSMTLIKNRVYDETTFVAVTEDFVIVSDNTIDITNLHFTVFEGVTLTFRARAVKIARDEASSLPLFEVSGTVIFEATGSIPALLDGSLVDEFGIVQVDAEDAVFLPGPDNIIRYHVSGITISKMEDTGGLPDDQATSMNPSVSSPTSFITVGGTLPETLVSSTGKSALWIAEHGSIIFAKETAKPSDASGHESTAGIHASVLIPADNGQLERVLRARTVVVEEMREGIFAGDTSTKRRSAWGWVPFRSRIEKDVERAREHFGEVEAALSNRGCLEVSVDGTCVLSKSGPFKMEWMNRFPWRRRKNDGYELHVKDDGMEVRLGEKRVWGVSADEMMD